ncbi:MAG TPA: hypothetical protein VE914_23525 [Candidatus Angelobacter sp.]|nr:hypothetical protein [Candidatus Angelobacter sp.]
MQTDDPDIDEIVSKPLPGDRQTERRRWPLVWPWLILLGLLIIGIGVYVPMTRGMPHEQAPVSGPSTSR